MGQPQRLDIAFHIRWEGAWHVGSGLGTEIVDRMIRRRMVLGQPRGVPFVPGSQVKGVLRHRCQQLLTTFDAPIESPHVLGPTPRKTVLDNFRLLAESKLFSDRLFGSRFQGDCLYVDDALPLGATGPIETRSQTAIDRTTGGARDQTLYTSEVVNGTDSVFQCRLKARHAPRILTHEDGGFPMEYSLLVAGLLNIECLGGNKSAGLGRCQIEIPGNVIRWNDNHEFPVAQALRSFDEEEWWELVTLCREVAS